MSDSSKMSGYKSVDDTAERYRAAGYDVRVSWPGFGTAEAHASHPDGRSARWWHNPRTMSFSGVIGDAA